MYHIIIKTEHTIQEYVTLSRLYNMYVQSYTAASIELKICQGSDVKYVICTPSVLACNVWVLAVHVI